MIYESLVTDSSCDLICEEDSWAVGLWIPGHEIIRGPTSPCDLMCGHDI